MAEPAIRQVQMHLFAQPSLRPDAEAIADQQHPDQELGIDGRTAGMAVEIREMAADAPQIDESVDGSQEVILRDVILQRELIEQRRLRLLPRSHHRRPSRPVVELNQPDAQIKPSCSTEYAVFSKRRASVEGDNAPANGREVRTAGLRMVRRRPGYRPSCRGRISPWGGSHRGPTEQQATPSHLARIGNPSPSLSFCC